MKLNSVYVAVSDMNRSVDFYSKLFRKGPAANTENYSEFELGPLNFALLNSSAYAHPLVPGNNCVPTFEVSSIEFEHTRIQRYSEKVSEIRQVGSYTLFEFADPDGNVLECFATAEKCLIGAKKSRSMSESAAHKAVDDWFEDYVARVYGLQTEKILPRSAKNPVGAQPVQFSSEELAERLAARFHELDLVPKDGLVSYLEIERAITNPLLHWDETDIAMLKLLRRYYHSLIELSDDEKERMDQGISIHDVDALAHGIGDRCETFRRQLEEEQKKA